MVFLQGLAEGEGVDREGNRPHELREDLQVATWHPETHGFGERHPDLH